MYTEEKRDLYDKLMQEKENGKVFSREDLTYDIMYELAIVEGLTDSLIGDIFNLKISQVRYLRLKYGLNNKFLKKTLDFSDNYIENMNQKLPDNLKVTDKNIYYQMMESFAKSKRWKTDIIKPFLNDNDDYNNDDSYSYSDNIDIKNYTNDSDILKNLEIEYDPFLETKYDIKNKKTTQKKRTSGKNINQKKAYENKIISGKIGEEIVYKEEIEKLKRLHLDDLVSNVKMITKTDYEYITNDGIGYDIVSYNEKREKIYIEVKCSLTNSKDNVSFFISEKEVAFMSGELDNIDKDHCFIYYVHDIDIEKAIAKILVINHDKFNKLKLNSYIYKVDAKII